MATAASAPPKHVLIVEDDQGVCNALEDILRDSGYSAEAVGDGQEALDRMRRRRPDLVLLDLMLPVLDGWGFLTAREADRDLASVPVLVISAVGPVGRRRAGELGAPVFLAKPFQLQSLLNKVEQLCDGPVRQCAWCRRVTDETGRFSLRSGRKLRWASHGICPMCKKSERRALVN